MDRSKLEELRTRDTVWCETDEGPSDKMVALTVAERDALLAYIDELERFRTAAFDAHPNIDLDIQAATTETHRTAVQTP